MRTITFKPLTKRVLKSFSLFTFLFSLLFVACNREESHVVVPGESGLQDGAAIIGFNTDSVTNRKFEDTHLYCFDAEQKMILHNYYSTQKELSRDMLVMKDGTYTIVAVLNVGENFFPITEGDKEVLLDKLLIHVKRVEEDFPNMITGMLSGTFTAREVVRMNITLFDKAGGITADAISTLTATITLPDAEFGEYQAARVRATASHNLRAVSEFFKKGTTELAARTTAVLMPAEQAGSYTMTVEVPQGEYDMVVWVDYANEGSTADLWYNTESLQAVTLIATDKSYTSGSAAREVFYGTTAMTIADVTATVSLTTERPQAKYLLIADDIERYRELMVANPEKYVPLDELSITIQYEGYLPDGFNALTGKPNSSELGYSYECELPAVGADDTEVRVADDYVFVNGTESSVVVTVVVTDKQGNTISRVKGITVQYKRNMVTTLRGDFLTAGVINPGINIDTDWDGVHEVEF